ncbi:MAG: SOS response-associated peptidase family protein, partial [Thermoanaerobaculia bacterium]|nr:SOS response-associated peptidase family protein [Thermoanaerobaculia bacterium]
LAGLWDRWSEPDGETLETFTILTRDASPKKLAEIHPRMPVVLHDSALWDLWLSPEADPADLQEAILEIPSPDFTIVPVSTRVNRVENDDPEVLEPRAEEPEGPEKEANGGSEDDTQSTDPRRGDQKSLF